MSKEDFLYFSKAVSLGAYRGGPAQSQQAHFTPVIMILAFSIGVIGILLSIGQEGINSVALFGFGYLASWSLHDFLIRLRMAQAQRNLDVDMEDPMFGPSSNFFTQDEFRQESNFGSVSYRKSSFKLLHEDSSYLLLFCSGMKAFIFPKTQLTDEEQAFIKEWAIGIPHRKTTSFNPE
ncbi:YcxB family protein [Cerasicoccus frondis]|uniref:YcxB family protein n=1 Tax=Cerasicoccus frondis TaxID=490090 RepID=UPI002852C36F|nr:YcxB family protein [Cerasicoccus frondis]